MAVKNTITSLFWNINAEIGSNRDGLAWEFNQKLHYEKDPLRRKQLESSVRSATEASTLLALSRQRTESTCKEIASLLNAAKHIAPPLADASPAANRHKNKVIAGLALSIRREIDQFSSILTKQSFEIQRTLRDLKSSIEAEFFKNKAEDAISCWKAIAEMQKELLPHMKKVAEFVERGILGDATDHAIAIEKILGTSLNITVWEFEAKGHMRGDVLARLVADYRRRGYSEQQAYEQANKDIIEWESQGALADLSRVTPR